MSIISKKRIYSKKLRKGTFHIHSDVNGGHPSLIYDKNDKKNQYKAICFTHEKGSRRTRLNHNINIYDSSDCYVINHPIVDKRKHFSTKELNFFRIHKDDKEMISKIKKRKSNR